MAKREPGGREITYEDLVARVDRLAGLLAARGARRGDRVAVWMEKSIDAVAAMQAALRLGAAYVPVDPSGPPARALKLLSGCRPAVCVTSAARASALDGDLVDLPVLLLDGDGEPPGGARAEAGPSPPVGADDLAYILYTSGSTGDPKGVCVSHANALAFIEWAHGELSPTAGDRFANHAPLHFDLSVLDIYLAFRSGGTAVLIQEGISFAPSRLVELIRAESITVWYSVPSALALMIEQADLLASPAALRAILFAGEPFPLKHLRRLREAFPGVRLLNLYGPTETNVCSFEEVFDVPDDRVDPVPIGGACCGDRIWAEDENRAEVSVGEEGELVVDGPTVMLGYWDHPRQSGPYRTRDLVRRIAEDRYEYVGRLDAMVKIRGNRVELGEVEAVVSSHPDVGEAAVVTAGTGLDACLVAFVAGGREHGPSLLEMKRHCAEQLPRYMLIHELRRLDALPRTGTGKLDRRALFSVASGSTAIPRGAE